MRNFSSAATYPSATSSSFPGTDIGIGTVLVAANRAQANADYFGRPYVVFLDVAGGLPIERYDAEMSCHNAPCAERFTPARYDDSNVKLLGE